MRKLQIIVSSQAAGVIAFAAVVLFLVHFSLVGPLIQGIDPPITWILLGIACTAFATRFVVVPGIVAKGRKSIGTGQTPMQMTRPAFGTTGWTQADHLVSLYTVKTVVGVALCEGPAFMMLIAYLLEGNPMTFVAFGVFLVAVFLHFPTVASVQDWVTHQLHATEEQRDWYA